MSDMGLWCRHQEHRLASRGAWRVGLSVWASLLVVGEPGWPAERSAAGESSIACKEVLERGGPTAEVTFPVPQPFVIIAGGPQDWRGLYAAGESIARPSYVGPGVGILRIDPGRVQVRDGGSNTVMWLEPGDPVPGVPGRFVAETTVLGGLNYHYGVAARFPDLEPRLICVLADHAHLGVAVPGPMQGGQVPAGDMEEATRAETLAHMRDSPDRSRGTGTAATVVEVGPHTYQVGATDLQEILDKGARQVAEAWASGWLRVPPHDKESQAIESPVADGTIGPRGFRLTNARWAGVAGLETGDLVLAVDGRAVNTLDDLYQAYQQVRRAGRRPRFEVTLERDGVQLTKTYLIQ